MLYLVFLVLGLSYLNPNSFAPWPNAQQDFFAILSFSLLFFYKDNKNLVLDKNIIAAFLILIVIIVSQYNIRIIYFRQDLYLSITYIGVFFGSLIIGLSQKKIDFNINEWSKFFTLIGLASVCLQLIQFTNFVESSLVRDLQGNRPFANLGQPNQLSTLLIIAYLSSIIMFEKKIISKYAFITIILTLLLGISLTQSRTSWLVFILLVFLTGLKRKFNLLSIFIFSSLYLYIFTSLLPSIGQLLDLNLPSLSHRSFLDYSRLDIWRQMIFAVFERPLLGYGWNQTSVAQTLISAHQDPLNIWIEYSHNLFIDLIVWVGIPIGLVLIIIIIRWNLKSFNKVNETESLIIFFIVFIFFIHCLLEFPFAYAYFLFPIGYYIGVLENKLSLKNNPHEYNFKYSKILGSLFIIFIFYITFEYITIKNNSYRYAEAYLFSKKNNISTNKIFFLDSLKLNSEINFLSNCYIIKNKSFDEIQMNYYRYPNNKSFSIYYQSYLYNKKPISIEQEFSDLKYAQINSKNLSKYKNTISLCK